MASLYGWAIKISWLGADHTYVTSSDGFAWGCWGRSSGGRTISSGTGSSGKANCISQPGSTAGIVYAISGVCHQTANRILYPVQAIVSAAAGYWASIILYGTYGTSLIEWEIRKSLCISGILGLKAEEAESTAVTREIVKVPTPETGIKDYLDKVNAIYTAETSDMRISASPEAKTNELLSQELALLLDYRLGIAGVTTDSKNIATLQNLQKSILAEKRNLDGALIGGKISAVEYAQKVNGLVIRFMKESGLLLGREVHTKVFGMPPDAIFMVVDPKELAKYHR